jgi:hypothetical protein
MEKQERDEKIELYARGYASLAEALTEVPPDAMKFKPEPKEWSVHEIVIHLADSESNAAMRARKLIVEPGGALMGYDQDQWAITLDYHEQDLQDALETVRLVRKSTVELLKKQPVEIFSHTVKHPEYDEPYTFEKWLNLYSRHIPGHIEQIRNNVRLWQERQK